MKPGYYCILGEHERILTYCETSGLFSYLLLTEREAPARGRLAGHHWYFFIAMSKMQSQKKTCTYHSNFELA
jgi:hypothetical protein